ncbi:DrmB family protein [Streptomyces sp. NPDC058733]|uniref:DrmB family protein n=1 Tax=Streptomyces sp. NPDC058733 TaxID=3346614 RepID=UPI00368CFBA5
MKRKLRVRQAQTVLPFGVGAILDVQGESFVAAGIERWPDLKTPVPSERLATRLGVKGFYAAPHTLNDRYDQPDRPGVPYVRFPGWLFCGACRSMVRVLREHEKPGEPPVCTSCAAAPRLTPMRFVRICADGHLDDVDWWYWAHSKLAPELRDVCTESKNAWKARRLSFRVADRASGLEALSVRCGANRQDGTPCGAQRDLLDILGPQGGHCPGRNPWQRWDARATCGQQVHIVQRTAGNVYYPVVYSALDIPQTTEAPRAERNLAEAVLNHGYWSLLLDALGTPRADTFRNMIKEDTEAPDSLIDHLVAEATGAPAAPPAAGPRPAQREKIDLSRDEWYAFDADRFPEPSKEFTVRRGGLGLGGEREEPWATLDTHIGKVVLVDRLREVRALTGFRRHSPNGTLVPADTSGRLRWLPATEVYGEGIVLTLDEQRLTVWEQDPRVRAHVLGVRADLDASFRDDQLAETVGAELSPRFLLLHTVAHLLIRQLSFDSGYTTASLRERVYGRPEYGQHGLLIHTAAGDAEGTLGGLVRQGEAPNFAETLIRMLEAAAWCSADPLCAEHTGQGFGNLNRAACHACTLLPETSCETGNTLLDRALVVGSARVPGYFTDVLTASREYAAATAQE